MENLRFGYRVLSWRRSSLGAFASKLALCVFLAGHLALLQGRKGAPPATNLGQASDLSDVSVVSVPEVNSVALLVEDAAEDAEEPLRFAHSVALNITPDTNGDWEALGVGGRIWRLRFHSAGATDLNLGFSRFRLPPGTTLHVISEDHDYYEGPYDHRDNKPHGELWLPVVPGNRAVIELYVPALTDYEPELRLSHIGVGYRDLFGLYGAPNLAKQGSCNVDVVCQEGDEWRDQIASVAIYTRNGSRVCTGQMIADVPGSLRSFFLTAYHCRVTDLNASTMVVYWNFESPRCGQLGGGSLEQNQTGGAVLASLRSTDFTLIELDDPPDPTYGVYYSGWDRSGVAPEGSVAIHHPDTDEKAISFNDDPLTTMDSCINSGGEDTHWRVDNWELGTTEPGSSGSGLWDPESKLLIGFLSGGQAACGNDEFDCYGKFSIACDGDDPSTRLRDWLDPEDTMVTSVEGSPGVPFISLVSDRTIDECALDPGNENGVWEPGETIRLPVTITGSESFTNITGKLTVDTPGITVLNDSASWPDMAKGTPAESLAPYFSVRVGSSVACLTTVDYSIEVSAAEGGPFILRKSGLIGSQLEAEVPVDIPDLQDGPPSLTLATSTIQVGANELIENLDVFVNIRHGNVGDLEISLRGPDGTAITLLDSPGHPAAPFGCADRDMAVVFSDSATLDAEAHCAGAIPWITGRALPIEALEVFQGRQTQGAWTLTVHDRSPGDSGTLEDWELRFDPPARAVCHVCGEAPDGADLAIVKRANGPIRSGVSRYTIVVQNLGPDPASGVRVEDVIRGANSILVPPACSVEGHTVRCSIGTLAVNQQRTYTIEVSRSVPLRSRVSGGVRAEGQVSGNEVDPQPGNNYSVIIIGKL